MEYAAYLRIVPFAAQNHALSILPMLLWSVKARLEIWSQVSGLTGSVLHSYLGKGYDSLALTA